MADQGSAFNRKCAGTLAMFAALISLCVPGAYAGQMPAPGTQGQESAPAETVRAALAAPLDVPAQEFRWRITRLPKRSS
jgi:hypothetical protein